MVFLLFRICQGVELLKISRNGWDTTFSRHPSSPGPGTGRPSALSTPSSSFLSCRMTRVRLSHQARQLIAFLGIKCNSPPSTGYFALPKYSRKLSRVAKNDSCRTNYLLPRNNFILFSYLSDGSYIRRPYWHYLYQYSARKGCERILLTSRAIRTTQVTSSHLASLPLQIRVLHECPRTRK